MPCMICLFTSIYPFPSWWHINDKTHSGYYFTWGASRIFWSIIYLIIKSATKENNYIKLYTDNMYNVHIIVFHHSQRILFWMYIWSCYVKILSVQNHKKLNHWTTQKNVQHSWEIEVVSRAVRFFTTDFDGSARV